MTVIVTALGVLGTVVWWTVQHNRRPAIEARQAPPKTKTGARHGASVHHAVS